MRRQRAEIAEHRTLNSDRSNERPVPAFGVKRLTFGLERWSLNIILLSRLVATVASVPLLLGPAFPDNFKKKYIV
jgi:hypothetical protein